ncbi:hypothetical protein Q7P37_004344 [Cladosporium fusiforme]
MSSCYSSSSFGSELKPSGLRPSATILSCSSSSSPPSSPSWPSTPSPKSSLYLAVKVRTLINAFRKRARPRSHSARKKLSDSAFCRDIEREAYREIDQYLGRKHRRHREGVKKGGRVRIVDSRSDAIGACERVDTKEPLTIINNAVVDRSISLTALASDDRSFLSRNAEIHLKRLSFKELQQLLIISRDLTALLRRAATSCAGAPAPQPQTTKPIFDLAYLANLEHLLLCLQQQLLRQLIHRCIELVRDHILECQKVHSRLCKDWFFEYPDARHPLSTTWPWAIKPSLAVLWGVCWMFIDPYYWNKEGNLVIRQGNREILIPHEQLDQFHSELDSARQITSQSLTRTAAASSNSLAPTAQGSIRNTANNNNNRTRIHSQMLTAGGAPRVIYPQSRLTRTSGIFRPMPAATSRSPKAVRMAAAQPHTSSLQPSLDRSAQRTSAYGGGESSNPFCLSSYGVDVEAAAQNQAAGSLLGLASNTTNTPAPYSAPPSAGARADLSVAGSWLPQEANFHQADPTTAYNNAYLHDQQAAAVYSEWQQSNHTIHATPLYPQPQNRGSLALDTGLPPSRPRSTSQVTPTITLSIPQQPYTPDSQAQPQDSHTTSATSNYAPNGFESVSFIDQNTFSFDQRSFPNNRFTMAEVSVAPQVGQIASPISDHPSLSRPISPSQNVQNVHMEEQMVRKRSFSEMSQGPPQPQQQQQQQQLPPPQMQMQPQPQPVEQHQSPQPPSYENSPGGGMEDVQGHKVQRNIKRGDPPQAHDGKYYCNFAPECTGQYFDRKCEWSKHMDKHDRPYRCPQPQCAKLQGFTYSGGLLRHEREVHGKHGGPKEQLRCTVAECKRHTGKGFTRKENLNEHLRRVHGITAPDAASQQQQHASQQQLRQIAADAAPGADLMETPASRYSEAGDMDDLNAATPAYPEIANKRRRLEAGLSPRSGSDDLEMELQRLKQDNLEKDERIRRMEENDAHREARMKSLEDTLASLTAHGLQRVPEQANMAPNMQVGNQMAGNIGQYPEFNGSVMDNKPVD